MDFDDIVIGSGLAALGATLGINPQRRVLLLASKDVGKFLYYDEKQTVPCAFTGKGGLGNDWHGVIPTGWRNNFGNASAQGFESMLRYFYPSIEKGARVNKPWLFVPWKAIRPQPHFARLMAERGEKLSMRHEAALSISIVAGTVHVTTAEAKYRASRVWLAAGALHTPALIENSFGSGMARGLVSDHAFCYIGQVQDAQTPKLTHAREGMFFPARYNESGEALYTLRPARFKFRQLDFGIEQRALFGLPTGNAVAKIARRASPGLLAEAFYNRFGLFPGSQMHSVYAQVVAKDAYEFAAEPRIVIARQTALRAATDLARQEQPYDGLTPSQMPDAFIPGIHLHHSLSRATLATVGIDTADSPVKVVDASTLENIGPDHHSFKMLLAAFDRVRATAS
jgi:hypothetical protein